MFVLLGNLGDIFSELFLTKDLIAIQVFAFIMGEFVKQHLNHCIFWVLLINHSYHQWSPVCLIHGLLFSFFILSTLQNILTYVNHLPFKSGSVLVKCVCQIEIFLASGNGNVSSMAHIFFFFFKHPVLFYFLFFFSIIIKIIVILIPLYKSKYRINTIFFFH